MVTLELLFFLIRQLLKMVYKYTSRYAHISLRKLLKTKYLLWIVFLTFGFMFLQLQLFGSFKQPKQPKQRAIAEDGLNANLKIDTEVNSLKLQHKVYISSKEKRKENRRKIQDHMREKEITNDKKRRQPLALAYDRVETEKDNVQERDGSKKEEVTSIKLKLLEFISMVTSDQLFWSDAVDKLIPKGLSNDAVDTWLYRSRQPWNTVASMQQATHMKCGGPTNGYAELTDGSRLCARYKGPHWWMMMGESLSYWLSRYLGMDNVPPVALTYSNSTTWSQVHHVVRSLNWTQGNLVSMVMWVDQLDNSGARSSSSFMPGPVLQAYKSGVPITADDFKGVYLQNGTLIYPSNTPSASQWSVKDIVLTAQWSTMIVFDYLTGNYDRVSSMQDGVFESNRSDVIEDSIRNLRHSSTVPKLWLVDNESGLLDAYMLLYEWESAGMRGDERSVAGKRHFGFHEQMLRTCCVFQKDLISRLKALSGQRSPSDVLEMFAFHHDHVLPTVKVDTYKYTIFKDKFNLRIKAVVEWIEKGCLRL